MDEPTCYCRCGGVWESKAKTNYQTGATKSEKPCPKCGRDDLIRRVSYPPEPFTVKG